MPRSTPTALAFAQLVQAELGTLGYESRIAIAGSIVTVTVRDTEGRSNGREITPPPRGVSAVAVARELLRGLGPPDPAMIQAVWGSGPARSESRHTGRGEGSPGGAPEEEAADDVRAEGPPRAARC